MDTITDNNNKLSEQKDDEPFSISEVDKKKLETALRWANNLDKEIKNILKLIIQIKNEAKKTVELAKTIEPVNDDKTQHELIDSEYEKLYKEREKAEKEAKEAKNAKESAEQANERQDVKNAQFNTDKLKEIKKDFEAFYTNVQKHKDEIFKNYNILLNIISDDKFKKVLHDSNKLVQEIEDVHEDYEKFFGDLMQINKAIRTLDYETGSTGDDLKIKILTKTEPIMVLRLSAENAFSEFVKIKERMKQNYDAKNIEEMQKLVENLDGYKKLFIGDKGYRDNIQIAYDTILIYYKAIKTLKSKTFELVDEEKHDEWQKAQNIEHLKQMHGISIDHISRALP